MTLHEDPARPGQPTCGRAPPSPTGASGCCGPGCGLLVLVILVADRRLDDQPGAGRPSPTRASSSSRPTTWDPAHGKFGALAFIYGTLVTSAIALVIAVPVSLGIALFLTELAPRRLRAPVVYVIDLLAAIPSVVFGLWGVLVPGRPARPAVRAHRPTPSTASRSSARCSPAGSAAQLHDRRAHRGPHDHADHHLAVTARCSPPCPGPRRRRPWPSAPPGGR